MWKRLIISFVFISTGALSVHSDPAPELDAVCRKHQPRLRQLVDRYKREMEKVNQAMVREYKILLTQSMRRGDLEAANQFQKKIEELETPADPFAFIAAAPEATSTAAPAKIALGRPKLKISGDTPKPVRKGVPVWHPKSPALFPDLPEEFDGLEFVIKQKNDDPLTIHCLKSGTGYFFLPTGINYKRYAPLMEQWDCHPTKHEKWDQSGDIYKDGIKIMKKNFKTGEKISIEDRGFFLVF